MPIFAPANSGQPGFDHPCLKAIRNRELLKSWEQGEWQSVADAELLDRYRQAARNTARKDKRVNIRISSQD